METIVSRLIGNAERHPQALAFIDAGNRVTYEELLRYTLAASAWLHRSGVRAGETVAVTLGNAAAEAPDRSLAMLWIVYGLAHLGAVILPLYESMPRSARERAISDFRARWQLGSGAG